MHLGIILEFYFCYDSDLDERSQGISGSCLHRISLRMYLDGLGSYSGKKPISKYHENIPVYSALFAQCRLP